MRLSLLLYIHNAILVSECDYAYTSKCENMVNWDNVEWIEEFWDEIPEPTLEQGVMALSLMIAELEAEI